MSKWLYILFVSVVWSLPSEIQPPSNGIVSFSPGSVIYLNESIRFNVSEVSFIDGLGSEIICITPIIGMFL